MRQILTVNLVNQGDAEDKAERRAELIDSMRSLGCDVAPEAGLVTLMYVGLPDDGSVEIADIAAFPEVERVALAQSQDANEFSWLDA